jgi:uncharacterized RDD family membrane protein YckC
MENCLTMDLHLEPEPRALRYAGFWRRLGANLVDVLVAVPVMWPVSALLSRSKTWWSAGFLPLEALGIVYVVSLHARYGQTLGKMVTRIRVVTLAGDPIDLGHSLRRASVDIVFVALRIAGSVWALQHVPASAWGHGSSDVYSALEDAKPAWFAWAQRAGAVWFWSEVLVLLFNRKRRALHDFIAGTVVIRLRRARGPRI